MIFAILENFFSQLVFWEKVLAAIIAIFGVLIVILKVFKKLFVNVRAANQSLSEFFELIPDLKKVTKDFGTGENSLKNLLARLENNLSHTDQKIKVIASCMGIAAFEADKNGLYTFISKKFSELTGVTFEEAIGNGWLNIVDDDDREKIYKEWMSCINQNREFHTSIRLSKHPDKEVTILAWPIRNLDKSVEKFFGIFI